MKRRCRGGPGCGKDQGRLQSRRRPMPAIRAFAAADSPLCPSPRIAAPRRRTRGRSPREQADQLPGRRSGEPGCPASRRRWARPRPGSRVRRSAPGPPCRAHAHQLDQSCRGSRNAGRRRAAGSICEQRRSMEQPAPAVARAQCSQRRWPCSACTRAGTVARCLLSATSRLLDRSARARGGPPTHEATKQRGADSIGRRTSGSSWFVVGLSSAPHDA